MNMPPPLKSNEPGSADLPPASGERAGIVRSEQVKLLYAKAHVVSVATLVNAPLLVFILWDEIRHAVLVAWLMYMVTLTLCRTWLTHEYWRKPPAPTQDSHWSTWNLVGIALAGLGWGSVSIFLFPNASLPHQLFLAFVLAGMTAGSVAAYFPILAGFLLFAAPALLPLTIRFLAQGDDLHLAMAAMTGLFLTLLVFLAHAMHHSIITSLNLQFENRDLIAYLSTSKRQTEKLNDELTFEINERRLAQKERERLIAELQDALANIKVLRGLLPICSHCKKIRDEEGAWQMVEVYVRDHSNADFSHGICPDCLNRLYPELGKNIPPD